MALSTDSGWYQLSIPVQRVVSCEHMRIQEAFEAIFLASGGPRDAALFSRRERGGDVTLLFSPSASRLCAGLVAGYAGSACARPSRKGTSLLVGDANAFDLLE
jgi:hypothetical protein